MYLTVLLSHTRPGRRDRAAGAVHRVPRAARPAGAARVDRPLDAADLAVRVATGVVVYWMLYRLYCNCAASSARAFAVSS